MQQSGKGVKRTLGQKTEDRLMKYILDKPVKIGERIPTEGELTELFEVGRSTVREAVKGLVTSGVLEVRRGDGTYVISWKMIWCQQVSRSHRHRMILLLLKKKNISSTKI